MSCDKALIFDIQDFCVQDGPGIRTTIFFKGCQLKCRWCSNPEGQSSHPELFYSSALCKKSNRCISSCPHFEVITGSDDYPIFNRKVCKNCDTKNCIDTCYSDAIRLTGHYHTVDEIIERIKPNMAFYRNSNGGVTLSGGEPLLQHMFVKELMNQFSETGISVGVETCGYFSWSDVSSFIDNFDFIYYDIKTLNEELHKKTTGKSNKKILSNLKKLSSLSPGKVIISIPVIPGVNDDENELIKIADHCKELNIKKIRLLPYHDFGKEKYNALGMEYKMPGNLEIKNDMIERFRDLILYKELECWIE